MLTIAGEIDLHTAPQLQDAVDTARPAPGRALYLDLAGVSFCDCSGLNLLRARARGPIRIRGTNRQMLRLLTLTGTRDMLAGPGPRPSALAS